MNADEGNLSRHLGLYAVFSISLGAMIGSGIFVLPGLAAQVAGPAVILSYLVAGVLMLPAALSQSEMATAMPEAGGSYLYIDRAMGPLMGTIAGFGVWFSLIFKAAFALVGLGAYLSLFADIPVKAVALVLAVVITLLNALGAKETGRFQAVLVTAVMIFLFGFIGVGSASVESSALEPFFSEGLAGVLAGAGLVFVSYAGVINVASVAEEVDRPHRNLPLGIITSVVLMTLVYPAIVWVVLGASGPEDVTSSLTPIATTAGAFLGEWGLDVVAVLAALALLSMANAGLLASSRYPFAMARNDLAPKVFQRVGSRGTPIPSILITSALLVGLIAFVPLLELAKLASAFQLLVLSMVNVAVIAFRESDLHWYRPSFSSPLYPWVQLAGIAGAVLLLTQMGLVPILGATAIIVGGVAWYRGFGSSRASRESASLDALRIRNNSRLVAMTELAIRHGGASRVLVPLFTPLRDARERDVVRIAGHLAAGGEIDVVWFATADEIRNANLAATGPSPERSLEESAAGIGVAVKVHRMAADDRRQAVYDYVWDNGVDIVLAEMPQETQWLRPVTRDLKWLRDNLECDTMFLRNRELDEIHSIIIMGSGGPYDVLKISMANRIAVPEEAEIQFVHVANESATDAQIAATRSYHTRLDQVTPARTLSRIERSENLVESLTRLARGANLVIIGAAAQRFRMFSDLADRIAEELDCPVLLVHARDSHRKTLIGRILEHLIY